MPCFLKKQNVVNWHKIIQTSVPDVLVSKHPEVFAVICQILLLSCLLERKRTQIGSLQKSVSWKNNFFQKLENSFFFSRQFLGFSLSGPSKGTSALFFSFLHKLSESFLQSSHIFCFMFFSSLLWANHPWHLWLYTVLLCTCALGWYISSPSTALKYRGHPLHGHLKTKFCILLFLCSENIWQNMLFLPEVYSG